MNAVTQSPGEPVIAHYDGTTWHGVPAPSPNGSGGLSGITGVPRAPTIWAVGGSGDYPRIERSG
jgi:hypothetical protein